MIESLGADNWFGLCLLAGLVSFTCGYLVVKL